MSVTTVFELDFLCLLPDGAEIEHVIRFERPSFYDGIDLNASFSVNGVENVKSSTMISTEDARALRDYLSLVLAQQDREKEQA